MPHQYAITHVRDVNREKAPRSGTAYGNLTDELGCTEIAVRIWFLEPGDQITYHRETAQEELYYVIDGPGQMRIDGEEIEVPEESMVRVPPEAARHVFNDSPGSDHTWLIAGAPKSESEAEYIEI
jgi:uncharacterized cupin superfamily protein